jgi:hypothetical protein
MLYEGCISIPFRIFTVKYEKSYRAVTRGEYQAFDVVELSVECIWFSDTG